MQYGLHQGASKQTICHACQISNLVYCFFKEDSLSYLTFVPEVPSIKKGEFPVNCAEDNVLYLLKCKVVFFPIFCCLKIFIVVETVSFVEFDIVDSIVY
jgi:hypothetical protein